MGVVDPSAHAAIVREVLAEYARLAPSQGDIEVELVTDDTHGHYELMFVGWEGWRRVHGTVVHVDLRGDEVWIQHDGTEAQHRGRDHRARRRSEARRARVSAPLHARAFCIGVAYAQELLRKRLSVAATGRARVTVPSTATPPSAAGRARNRTPRPRRAGRVRSLMRRP